MKDIDIRHFHLHLNNALWNAIETIFANMSV